MSLRNSPNLRAIGITFTTDRHTDIDDQMKCLNEHEKITFLLTCLLTFPT